MSASSGGKRAFALLGDPYALHAVRGGLSERSGESFVRVRQTAGGHTFSVLLFEDGARSYVDVATDWEDAPSEARAQLLTMLEVDAALIAGVGDSFATSLSIVRELGTIRVAGATRKGTRSPALADQEAILAAGGAFAIYTSLAGFPEGAPFVDLDLEWPREAALSAERALEEACTMHLPRPRPHARSYGCAMCGARVSRTVTPLDAANASTLRQGPVGDESLAPFAHVLRGDGTTHQDGYWTFSAGRLYFHLADWLDPDEHGSGLFGCCGFRPDPALGFNLACPNGHGLGELFSDCCSPQGVHVPKENLVER